MSVGNFLVLVFLSLTIILEVVSPRILECKYSSTNNRVKIRSLSFLTTKKLLPVIYNII